MNAPQTELPRYRCHKIVRAAKITAIERDAVTMQRMETPCGCFDG